LIRKTMQYKLLFVFAALLVCSQALTVGESIGVLYTINNNRYVDLVTRMKEASFSDNRDTLLKTSITSFAFNCSQVAALISTYTFEDSRVVGLDILKANIIDPQNKVVILNCFSNADAKKKATDLLTPIVACKTEGPAPEKFPFVILPYKDQWNQSALETLINDINAAPFSDRKLEIAEKALTSTSNILTSEQACVLYESFVYSADMLALTEFVKDRIVGLTCEQVISILVRFSFQDDKLDALRAFKHNIIDVENKLTIVDTFTYISSKDEARKILDDLKPKSYLFGLPTGKSLFALDVSTSMSTTFTLSNGQKSNRLEFVKKEFAKTVATFDNTTEFNVFPYSTSVFTWKTGGLQKATQANISSAIAYSKTLTPNGGTNIYAVLQAAWAIPGLETIYLLTDGSPSVGTTNVNTILNDVQAWYAKTPIQINTIAFLMGSEKWDDKPASRKLMSALASVTNGIYRAVESDN
jgi:hypothetical protein